LTDGTASSRLRATAVASLRTQVHLGPKSKFSQSDAYKKETVHKHHHHPILNLRFSPWRRFALSKQCLQQGHCQAQPIKARPWVFIMKAKTLYSACAAAPTCRCRCYESRITKQSPHRHEDSIRHYKALDLSHHDVLRHCLHHGNRNTDVSHNVNRYRSFASHPLEATRAEIGVHMTESHPIQQSTGVKHPMKISGGAFRNSLTARSMRAGNRQNTILEQKEPKDRATRRFPTAGRRSQRAPPPPPAPRGDE
jgi:hypothetical protein